MVMEARPSTKSGRTKKAPPPNTLFPGRENYTGPNTGWFAMLHHTQLFENTDGFTDGVKERIEYVREHKPRHEVKVRLDNMMYIGDCPEIRKLHLLVEVKKAGEGMHPEARDSIGRQMQRLSMETRLKLNDVIGAFTEIISPAVLAYVKKHNPTHAWRTLRGRPAWIGKVKGTR